MFMQIKIKIIITDRNSQKKILVDQLFIIIFFNIDDYFSYFIIAYYIYGYANSLLNRFFFLTKVINVYTSKTNLFVQLSFQNNVASLSTYSKFLQTIYNNIIEMQFITNCNFFSNSNSNTTHSETKLVYRYYTIYFYTI